VALVVGHAEIEDIAPLVIVVMLEGSACDCHAHKAVSAGIVILD
jgi:hypothetical protein